MGHGALPNYSLGKNNFDMKGVGPVSCDFGAPMRMGPP